MKTHPITFRAGSRISCLRQDFVAICGGDSCAAAVLGQMMYWHEVKMAHQDQAERENEKLSRMGKPRTQVSDLWVYKSQAEMQAELLNIYGKNSVGAAFSLLLEQQFLLSRSNDEDKRDRTKQYLFHVANVQNAVNELPLLTMDYPARDDVAIPATGRCNSLDREMQFPLQGDALPATGHSMRGRVVNPKTTSETTYKDAMPTEDGGVSAAPTSEQDEIADTRKASATPPQPKGSAAAPAKGKAAPRCEAKWKPDDFNRLMDSYPKRDDRADAVKAWETLRPNDEFVETLVSASVRWSAHHKRKCTEKQWIRSLGVWLNNGTWRNEVCLPVAPPAPTVSRPASGPTAPIVYAPKPHPMLAHAAEYARNMEEAQAERDAAMASTRLIQPRRSQAHPSQANPSSHAHLFGDQL